MDPDSNEHQVNLVMCNNKNDESMVAFDTVDEFICCIFNAKDIGKR